MLNLILRRLSFLPVVFFALSLMIFSLQMMLTPIQRLSAYISNNAELKGGREQIASLIEKHGLDDPFLVQPHQLENHTWAKRCKWPGNLLTDDPESVFER